MESKLEHFLDNGIVFNMLVIQKGRNKIYQKDGYLPFKIQCLYIRPTLHCIIGSDNIFSFCCVKSVQIRSFFWCGFSYIWTEYGDLVVCVFDRNLVDQEKLRIWTLFTQCVSALNLVNSCV